MFLAEVCLVLKLCAVFAVIFLLCPRFSATALPDGKALHNFFYSTAGTCQNGCIVLRYAVGVEMQETCKNKAVYCWQL